MRDIEIVGEYTIEEIYKAGSDFESDAHWNTNDCKLELYTRNIVFYQFTGLLDKNGTKIFEGDYVISDHKLYGEYEQGVVEYTHTGQYVLAQGSFKTSIHDLVFNDWKLEVIGNIYQSPELVKGDKAC